MLNKLQSYKERFDFLQQQIAKPEVIQDNKKYKELSQEYSHLMPIVELYEEYAKVSHDIELAQKSLKGENDDEMANQIGRAHV